MDPKNEGQEQICTASRHCLLLTRELLVMYSEKYAARREYDAEDKILLVV